MSSIKYLLLAISFAISTYGYSANITISGIITEGDSLPKVGIMVIWTDSASGNSDTSISNSTGAYQVVLNSGSFSQGVIKGKIINCSGYTINKRVLFSPGATNFNKINFKFCYWKNGFLEILGGIADSSGPKAGIQVIWTDSSSNLSDTTLSDVSGNYKSLVNIGASTSGNISGYIYDCKGAKIIGSRSYTIQTGVRPTVNYSFGYCSSPGIISISGIVYDSTGSGVKSGLMVYCRDSLTNIYDSVLTDSQGKYLINLKVSSVNSGRVFCTSQDCNGNVKKKTLAYGSGLRNLNWDFIYCSKPILNLSTVHGIVNSKDTATRANGIIILIEKSGNNLQALDTITLYNGAYSITLPDSNKEYLIKAILSSSDPNYANHLPTYLGNELKWSKATLIPKGGNKTYLGRDILCVKGTNPGGPGFIGGDVRRGANKMLAIGDPIEGQQIMLFKSGDPVAYTFSDSKGKFSFDNLDLGVYTIYPELVGLPSVSRDVTLTISSPKIERANISINSSGATTVITSTQLLQSKTEGQIRVFPNPTENEIAINFGNNKINTIITITDLSGKVMITETIVDMLESRISLSNLPNGNYFLHVKSSEKLEVFKILKY